jgi:hypothetical protein
MNKFKLHFFKKVKTENSDGVVIFLSFIAVLIVASYFLDDTNSWKYVYLQSLYTDGCTTFVD